MSTSVSRREGCIWHPMPEEVRRSSVQSRRASLAAGRRKDANTNEPDWEVEAPSTPPQDDFSPRNPEAAAARKEADAAVAATSAGAAATAATTEEENKKAAAEAAKHSEQQAVQETERQAVAEEEEEVAVHQSVGATSPTETDTAGRGKTRHTIRFHGGKWRSVLKTDGEAVKENFLKDVEDCTGIHREEAKRLKITMTDCMVISFIVYSDSKSKQNKIHTSLQSYKYPRTCSLYHNAKK